MKMTKWYIVLLLTMHVFIYLSYVVKLVAVNEFCLYFIMSVTLHGDVAMCIFVRGAVVVRTTRVFFFSCGISD